MFKLSAFLFIILIIIGNNDGIAQARGLSLKTVSQQSGNKKIQKLLVIGGGNTVTRIFLDDVASEISRTFLAADIETSSIVFEQRSQLDTMNMNSYDAFLIFSTDSVKWSNKLKDKTWLSTPLEKSGVVGGYLPTLKASSKFQGEFRLFLLQQMEDSMNLTWEGDLTVSLDMAKKKRYKKVVSLINTELRKNKVIAGK